MVGVAAVLLLCRCCCCGGAAVVVVLPVEALIWFSRQSQTLVAINVLYAWDCVVKSNVILYQFNSWRLGALHLRMWVPVLQWAMNSQPTRGLI